MVCFFRIRCKLLTYLLSAASIKIKYCASRNDSYIGLYSVTYAPTEDICVLSVTVSIICTVVEGFAFSPVQSKVTQVDVELRCVSSTMYKATQLNIGLHLHLS